jgi:cell division protein FtsW (lipid II flippase)
MVRASRFRLVELELLLIPALLLFGGLALVILVDRGAIVLDWRDLATPIAFAALLLASHLFLTLSRFRGDQVIFPCVAMITALGMVVLQRLEQFPGNNDDLYNVAGRQTLWVFVGLVVMLVAAMQTGLLFRLRRYKYTLGLLGVAMMAALLIPRLGVSRGGARLWYDLGFTVFQPSELVKIILVFFFASYLDERREVLATTYRVGPLRLPPLPYLGPMVLMWGLSLLMLIVLRDLGSALLFFGIFVAMLYTITGRAWYVLVLMGCFFAGAYFAYQTFGHVQTRVDTWIDPSQNANRGGFQIIQSLYALASGGVYGSGLGAGIPTVMPAVHTDMIFAALGEELGLVATLATLGLYLTLVYRGFFIAMRARHGFYQLMAVGLTAIFGLQSLIILAGTTKLAPLTGITLPFISYGGSSIVTNFLMAGLLLGISGAERRELPR